MSPDTQRLSLRTLRDVPSHLRPVLDPRSLTVGVAHLGLGAFHRAHQLAYLEEAARLGDEPGWAVAGFSERSPKAASVLAEQDGLYSLRLASPAGETLRVLASLRDAAFAGDGGVVARIADPAVHLVTLTVTEKGYRHDPATGRLRRDDPDVLADAAALADGAGAAAGEALAPGGGAYVPRTVPGQLAHGLAARRYAGAGPLTVLSCDNLPANGLLLAGLVGELIELAGGDAGAGGLGRFVGEQVGFPCSMVDRIVPAATPEVRAAAAGELGVRDEAAVVAEPFGQWVIEDRFAGPRPVALEAAGVQLVGDVAPYETLKLRVLNGSHSALAYLGALSGRELIAQAVALPELGAFVRSMVDEEVAPSLEVPPGVELAAYRDQVLERFANPVLAHRCLQVASDGSQKLPQRVLQTVRSDLAAGGEPRRAVLVVAGWVWAICHGRDESGRPLEVSDPLAPELRRLAGGVDAEADPRRLAERALSLRQVFGDDLAGDGRMRALLAEALTDLACGPVVAVAAAYASGRRTGAPRRADS